MVYIWNRAVVDSKLQRVYYFVKCKITLNAVLNCVQIYTYVQSWIRWDDRRGATAFLAPKSATDMYVLHTDTYVDTVKQTLIGTLTYNVKYA